MLRLSLVAVLAVALAPFGRVVAQQTAAPSPRPEAILPNGTLLYIGTDDFDTLVKRSKASPMGKIFAEQEVKDFLAKPLAQMRQAVDQGIAMAKQQPQLADLDLDVDKILAGAYGRAFLAITQFEFGLKDGAFDPNAVDVGLVIGIEPRAGAVDVLKMMRQVVGQLVASAGGDAPKFETIDAGGVTYDRLKNPTGSGALCFATLGGMTVMSLSEKSIAAIAGTAKSASLSLMADPDFTRCVTAVGAPAVGDLVVYAQLGRLVDRLGHFAIAAMGASGEKEMGEIVAKMLDISKIGSLGPTYATSQWRDGTSVNLSYSEVDPSVGGLCALAAKQPVDLGLIKMVPKDALSFSISSLDVAPFWDTVFGALKEAAPDVHGMAIQKVHEFETMVAGADAQGNPNWDVRRDLLGVIGGHLMSISTPGAGSMMGPGADSLFWIETSNAATLEKSLGYLFALPAQLGYPINFKEQVYGDVKLKVLDPMSLGPLAMAAGSMQPTWCIHDGRFWFATTTKLLKRALDAEKPPQPDPATGAAPPPRENITAKADFAKRWVDPPKGAVVTSVSYSDTATNFENTYQGLLGLIPMLQMGLQQQGMKDLPIDVSLLPTGEAIAQHLFGTVATSYRVGDRAHMTQSRGPFGPEAMVAMAGLVGAGVGMVAYQQQHKAATEAHHAKSAKSAKAPKSDPLAQTQQDFADISASITVYIITNNKPPAELADLTKPAPDYPKGYAQGQPLPLDPWGHAYGYSTDGKDDYKLWSFGPNGVDDHGAGDDIVYKH